MSRSFFFCLADVSTYNQDLPSTSENLDYLCYYQTIRTIQMTDIKKDWYKIISIIVFVLCSINTFGQIQGCTDPLAVNYNPSAISNDGSCVYNPSSVIPSQTLLLDNSLNESSGLIIWNDLLWTHNDSEDINIYALELTDGIINGNYSLTGSVNKDWEEISQDDEFFYIGDFGNNLNGNRQDLMILRIKKNSITANPPEIDEILFSYPDQTDFAAVGANNTDFDCEAFIVSDDSIYIFTKQWISNKTTVYSLPKIPGTYVAKKRYTYDIEGLITGATYLQSKQLIALCGYSELLEPFIYLLYDFSGTDFFGGNKRKVNLSLPFHQIEGITTMNGLKYYLTNENLKVQSYINVPQKLHISNLNFFLENYLESISSEGGNSVINNNYLVYPVPSENKITIKSENILQDETFQIINYTGQTIMTGKLRGEEDRIDISSLSTGLYILKIGNKSFKQFKIIRK